MEMQEIKKMSFKEKDKLLRYVFREYQKAKMIVDGYEAKNYYPILSALTLKEGGSPYQLEKDLLQNLEKKENSQKMIDSIDYVLNTMEERSKELIIKEFYEKDTSNWWMEYYSRSTYYRLKNKAMQEILYYLLQ